MKSVEEWSPFFAPVTKEDKALRDWFHARSIFLGSENNNPDVELGIQLAAQCITVPEAMWLCSLFPNRPPKTREEALTVLKEKTDSTSIGYCAFLQHNTDGKIYKAGTLGSIMAQADYLCWGHDVSDDHRWFHTTLQAKEPRAFFAKSRRATNLDEERYYLLQSARLGLECAIFAYAYRHMDDTDPERCAALLYCCMQGPYMLRVAKTACSKCITSGCAPNAVYRIGSILSKRQMLIDLIAESNVAISLFNSWTQIVKLSVVNWQLAALRLRICKDIRLLIARLIWSDRWNVIEERGVKKL
jgi:hypothetical protein